MTSVLTKILRLFASFLSLVAVTLILAACGSGPSVNAKANKPLNAGLVQKLAMMGSSPSEPMMIRIFKESDELEIWKRTRSGDYKMLVSYDICAWSGDLGPKIKEGDRQAPEGFYNITPGLMNPNSNYYLSFNTGFPNKFDRAWGRTGANLMVHGDCSSAGCYAMTDEQIADIYALARESFKGGNTSFQLQIFPFRMTPANIAKHASNPNADFWNNIKQGYDSFEVAHRPPTWDVCDKRYVFNMPSGTAALDATAACPSFATDATMVAALNAKQQADAAAIARELTTIQNQEERAAVAAANDAEAAARLAAADAKAKQRGQAIGGFFAGVGAKIGLGGGNNDASADVASPKVIDPTLVAPIPAPRIQRS